MFSYFVSKTTVFNVLSYGVHELPMDSGFIAQRDYDTEIFTFTLYVYNIIYD